MGFHAVGSGLQFRALSTGTSDVSVVPSGAPLSYDLSPLPVENDGLANYLAGFFITFSGSISPGASGIPIPQMLLLAILIDSISLNNAKHGTPISPNFVKGWMLPTISFVGGGYNYCVPNMGNIPPSNAVHGFDFSFFLPLCLGNGDRPHHTMQLQALYRKAQLVIQFNNLLARLQNFIPTATAFTSTIRVSAAHLPEREIRVGPGIEWVDYQTPASANQTEVKLQSFGNNTQLNNSSQGAGVAFAMAMSNVGPQPGSFAVDQLQQIQIPFRGQIQTTHVHPVVLHQQLASMGVRRAMGQNQNHGAGLAAQTDTQDFPYYAAETTADTAGSPVELTSLLGAVIVPQADGIELSKIQVVNGDVSYYMSLATGPAGTHHTLVQHVRSWEAQMWSDAEKEIVDSGLKRKLFGDSTVAWAPKLLYGKHPGEISPKKLRFLPMTLKPITAKGGSRFFHKLA